MLITVRLFAVLRERAGTDALTLTLPDAATVKDARAAIAGQLPALRDLLARSAPAVNCEYARDDAPLHDGDELALIPPVSGG